MNDSLSMRETAIGLHEFFDSLCKAGFTREEAIQLTISMVKGAEK